MMQIGRTFVLLLALASPLQGDHPAAAVHSVKLNGQTFTLPAGFDIELAAGPPVIERPIAADFDPLGRLYVASSSGTNESVEQQLRTLPHRILRLESSHGDGRFDRSTVFADRMMFPEGVLWNAGSLYVAAPPSIWKLSDPAGKGSAEDRSEWLQGKALTGCANDLHGPYPGPDGWIYWCKGAFARQVYPRPGKKPLVTRAAHIFRARLDGSGIEPVMTGGMDNPVHVVFTPSGERIFSTTFFQHPAGGRRDGLVHAVYGGVYGKDHDVIYEHSWTGPSLMPVLTHLGPAAPCGLLRYESAVFGPDYQDNLFACLFNLHKVTRHVLRPSGSTFTVRDEDFLVSTSLDFHPTAVLEDADGTLLVLDTGGWYKLCCPTSQLHKPDLLGAIYRIRRRDATGPENPRGEKLSWNEMSLVQLVRLLDDPRVVVRKRAIQVLAQKGPAACSSLTRIICQGSSALARQNAIWAATRIDHPEARTAVRAALADPDESVRQVACHSISVVRDGKAVPALIDLLAGASLHNRRVAAEALGRIGNHRVVPMLLDAAGKAPDRILHHSCTYALIEIADPDQTRLGLRSASPSMRRAALAALDQMENGGLQASDVAPEVASPDKSLRETALWIMQRHPDWGGALVGFLRHRLQGREVSSAERRELVALLGRLAGSTAAQELLAEKLRDPGTPTTVQQDILRAMGQADLKPAPSVWVQTLTEILTHPDHPALREAVKAARELHVPSQEAPRLGASLRALARRSSLDIITRLTALAAIPGELGTLDPELFPFLTRQLGADQPVARRALAGEVLGKARLSLEQQVALADLLHGLGPMEVARLLETVAWSKEEKVGLHLVAALRSAAARSSLRADTLRSRLAPFGPRVQRQAEPLLAELERDAGKQKARIDELLAGLKPGDVRRGQAVFHSPKAACASCHAIGYLGGKVGPDLTQVGRIRGDRDLLEAIVFPSASLVRSFEPVLVTTHSGKSYNGLLSKDGPDEVVLVTGADQQVRVPRDEIEDLQPSKVSIMPAGLDQQLSRQELADLIAFLRACR